jgi:hypothetical protein
LVGVEYKDDIFFDENLFVKRISTKPEATIINEYSCSFNTLYSIYNLKTIKKHTLLAILNSKLISFYYEYVFNLGMSLTTQITIEYLKKIPIALPIYQQPFIEKADKMLELNKQFQQKKNEFLSRVKDNFSIEKTSNKLEAFYNFDFKTFVAEIEKQKNKVTLTQQVEWEEFFNTYKAEINNLQTEINQTDKAIDQMVYELYGLTEEEIGIIEHS